MTLLFAVALALCVAAVPQPVAPGILIFVDSTGDGVNTGSGNVCDDGTGHCTLRAAIQLVNARNNGADSIVISATGTITLNSALPNLSVPVSINGPGADSLTVARNLNSGAFHIFNVTSTGTVSLSGLTISNGLAPGDGGGIQNASTGTVNVSDCRITANQAINGGGVSNATNGRVNLTNCWVDSNQAQLSNDNTLGGGVYNPNGSVTITNSTLSGNTARGCLRCYNSEGGGVYNAGTLIVVNSTIKGNGVSQDVTNNSGGGIFNANVAVITNSTIAYNISSEGAAGVESDSNATTQVKSSIIALNTLGAIPRDVEGAFLSSGFNLIGDADPSTGFTAATDQTGTFNAPLDPKFDLGGLRDNGGPTQTIALRCGSPAIDKGSSAGLLGTLTTDQRGTGFARTVDDPVVSNATGGDGTDIGAFEYGASPIVPTSAVSRKFHGSGNPPPHFDVPLPLTSCGSPGIECRRNTGSDTTGPNVGHDHELIVTFGTNVTVGEVDVVDESTGFSTTTTFSVSNNVVTVDLHNIDLYAARLTVNLRGVSDGANTGLVSIPMGVLLGDVNGSGRVDAMDVTLVRQNNFAPLDQTAGTFRDDVNVSGRIDAQDVTITRQQNFTFLP